jgi:hypothetical protein
MPLTSRLEIIKEMENEADNESWRMIPAESRSLFSIETVRPKNKPLVIPDMGIEGEQELYFIEPEKHSSVVSSHGTSFLWNKVKKLEDNTLPNHELVS